MGERDDEAIGRNGAGDWLRAQGAGSRTQTVFWTSPQIRSFPPLTRVERAELHRLDTNEPQQHPRPGGDGTA